MYCIRILTKPDPQVTSMNISTKETLRTLWIHKKTISRLPNDANFRLFCKNQSFILIQECGDGKLKFTKKQSAYVYETDFDFFLRNESTTRLILNQGLWWSICYFLWLSPWRQIWLLNSSLRRMLHKQVWSVKVLKRKKWSYLAWRIMFLNR